MTQGWRLGRCPSTCFGANPPAGWSSVWSCQVGCYEHLSWGLLQSDLFSSCMALAAAASLRELKGGHSARYRPETMSQNCIEFHRFHSIQKLLLISSQTSPFLKKIFFLNSVSLLHLVLGLCSSPYLSLLAPERFHAFQG